MTNRLIGVAYRVVVVDNARMDILRKMVSQWEFLAFLKKIYSF